MVLANGSMSASGQEGNIRRAIVEAGIVEGIIAMPDRLFYSTGIPVCLWIINKQKSDKTLFIDARNMGTMVNRRLRDFTADDIAKVAKTFDDFRAGNLDDIPGYCAVATSEEIAKQDFILTPGRYVGIPEAEEDSEPFDQKMSRLTTELKDMFQESNQLQEKIDYYISNIKGYND